MTSNYTDKQISDEIIINTQLLSYYEDNSSFVFNKNEICYNNKTFFVGEYNKNKILETGRIYNMSNNEIIYDGKFTFGLPTGRSCVNNCTLLWLNGCIFNSLTFNIDELKLYARLNIQNADTFNFYKSIVTSNIRDKYNICYLHISKFILCDQSSVVNNNGFFHKEIVIAQNDLPIIQNKVDNYTMYVFDHKWQIPVSTEHQVFKLYQEKGKLPCDYFAFPWATLLDQLQKNKAFDLNPDIVDYKVKSNKCFTVCQHIHFRKLIPLFKKIGITHVFASHCSYSDIILEQQFNIRIIPFQIYPYNTCDEPSINENAKYLFSFQGCYNEHYYLNNVRQKIFDLPKKNDIFVSKTTSWHFNDAVFNTQIKNKDYSSNNIVSDSSKEVTFKSLLLDSDFSLCPNGSGPNSIRLWESLSHGCIPVILSNNLMLPDCPELKEVCVVYNDMDISNLYTYLNNISKTDRIKMKLKCKSVFNKYFSIHKMNVLIDNFFINN